MGRALIVTDGTYRDKTLTSDGKSRVLRMADPRFQAVLRYYYFAARRIVGKWQSKYKPGLESMEFCRSDLALVDMEVRALTSWLALPVGNEYTSRPLLFLTPPL